MDRKKPPTLTSPWKIGFFVSLLLVTTSIAVGFLITRTFGLSWSWIQYAGGTWAFDKESFLGEMLPLVVLVPLLSLFSYFLITGAVRKYKAYLDSGLEYRNLIKCLEKIDDLHDKEKLKTLSNYPELRDFLIKAKDRISERESALNQKEKELSGKSKDVVVSDEVKTEVGVLISAISNGSDNGFKEELSLSLPEMKRIENAIRQHLAQGRPGAESMGNSDVSELMANLRDELRAAALSLREKFDDIASEFSANENGARELEEQLSGLKGSIESNPAPEGNATNQPGISTVSESLVRLDEASKALEALGEETKGVAINTALQAGSGQGGTTELIKLADDVRELAAKFNGTAQSYLQAGVQIKSAVENSVPSDENGSLVTESLTEISNKIALWVERAVVLSSKLKLFQEHYQNSIEVLELKLGGDGGENDYQSVQDLSVDAEVAREERDEAAGPVEIGTDDFERQGQVSPLDDSQAESGEEVPGIEKEEGIFEEPASASEEELFADIPVQQTADFEEQPEPADSEGKLEVQAPDEAPVSPEIPASVEAPDPVETDTADHDEMFEEIDVPGNDVSDDGSIADSPPAKRDQPGDLVQSQMNLSDKDEADGAEDIKSGSAVEEEKTEDSGMSLDFESHRYEKPEPAAKEKDEEQIIDLYDLGAVDYQPDSLQHNA